MKKIFIRVVSVETLKTNKIGPFDSFESGVHKFATHVMKIDGANIYSMAGGSRRRIVSVGEKSFVLSVEP